MVPVPVSVPGSGAEASPEPDVCATLSEQRDNVRSLRGVCGCL